MEKTLVLIKPDGMQRNLSEKIISRFEKTGLKITAKKTIQADESLAKNHYPLDEDWAKNVFKKSKASAEKEGRIMEFNNYMEMGKEIQLRLVNFLTESPVTALVLEGEKAVEVVRKLIGHTEPKQAPKGTIRGDFASEESYQKADKEKRAIRNLVHASDSKKSAEREIALWFPK